MSETGSPFTSTVSSAGRSGVDLPQPEGPTRETQVDAVEGAVAVVVGVAQVLCLQHVASAFCRSGPYA